MAARKKKAPARKARKRTAAARKRAAPRELPSDEAWRELIETALEKPDPVSQRVSPQSAERSGSAKKAKKVKKAKKAGKTKTGAKRKKTRKARK